MATQFPSDERREHPMSLLGRGSESDLYPAIPERLSVAGKTRAYLRGAETYYVWPYLPARCTDTRQRSSIDLSVHRFIRHFQAPSGMSEPYREYKNDAIRHAAAAFTKTIPAAWRRRGCIFVPIPPSRLRQDPAYDDRVRCALDAVSPPLPVHDGLSQLLPTRAKAKGMTPWMRAELLRFDCKSLDIRPHAVIVVDDVVASGAHFAAARMVIRATLPGVAVCGLFLAASVAHTVVTRGESVAPAL